MNISVLTSAVLTAVIISSTPIAVLPQDRKKPDQGAIKLTAELVQIDVLVTDKSHKPVGGLTRGDFQLYDNNKLQSITNFAYEDTYPRRIDDVATQARTLPRAITAG